MIKASDELSEPAKAILSRTRGGFFRVPRKDEDRVHLWARHSDYSAAFACIRDAVAALPVQ